MTAEVIEDVWVRMPRGRGWTWADLQEIPDDGHRYEIVDGSLHVSPSPSRPHQVAAGRVRDLLLAAAPDEVEVVETVDIEMDNNVFEPDVVVLPAPIAYATLARWAEENPPATQFPHTQRIARPPSGTDARAAANHRHRRPAEQPFCPRPRRGRFSDEAPGHEF